MKGIFRNKISPLLISLLLFLSATSAHALPLINTFADGTYGINSYTDPKQATSGNITSNLFVDLNMVGMTDAGNAIAKADVNGYLADRAGVGSGVTAQFDAKSVWSGNLTSNGTFVFNLSGGYLNTAGGSATYDIEIWNNGTELWSSSASVSRSANGNVITKSGTDLNGTTYYDPNYKSFSYTFGAYDGILDATAGTLTYFIDCIKIGNGGVSYVGNVYQNDSGFTGSFTPSTQVPEPASVLLFSAGLFGIAALRRLMSK